MIPVEYYAKATATGADTPGNTSWMVEVDHWVDIYSLINLSRNVVNCHRPVSLIISEVQLVVG